MRLLSGERQPQDQLEREMLAHLRSLRLKPEVAERIVGAFDDKPQTNRQALLGHFADKSHVLASIASAAPTRAVVRDHRGRTSPVRVADPVAKSSVARDHRRGASPGGATSGASSSRAWPASGTVGPLDGEMSTGAAPSVRYTVRYKGLWCQQETHGYLPGSDEIYVITSGLAINKGVNTAVEALTHPINTHDKYYGDVDTGEQRVGPVATVYTGNPDTLSLAVVVMEHDEGDPDYYRDEVNTFVAGAIAVATWYLPPAALLAYFKDNIVDAINWILDTGDDVISSEVMTWERPALEALAIEEPRLYQGTKLQPVGGGPFGQPHYAAVDFVTDLLAHFVSKHHGDGAEYVVGFDIERNPPRPAPIFL
ncbi:hypothetical protein [Rhodanobacter lindaniclasticus]